MYQLELLLARILFYSGIYWLRKKWLLMRGATVVLVYHRILEGEAGTGEFVGLHSFEWQMAYLRKHWSPRAFGDLVHAGGAGGGIEVLVTFDDGYRDIFTRALPVIEKYEIPAIFFVATDLVFAGKSIERGPADEDSPELFPSSDDLDRAVKSPFVTIGNHTASHRFVSQLSAVELETEIAHSQEAFAEKTGVTPDVFAYPRGRRQDLSAAIVPMLEKHGIKAAFTMLPGFLKQGTDRYFIPRIGVSHVNNHTLFKVKVLGLLNPLVELKNYLELWTVRFRRD
jgi:peptidoglycan/xylan/chitin deacetylase (PgdA/CDA1 family)